MDKYFKEIIIDTVNNIKDSDIETIIKKYNQNKKRYCTVKNIKDIIKNEKTIEKMAKNQIDITEKAAQEIVNNKIDEIVKKITERKKLNDVVLRKIQQNTTARKYEEMPQEETKDIIEEKFPNVSGTTLTAKRGVNVYFYDIFASAKRWIGNIFGLKDFDKHNFTLNFIKQTEEYIFTSNIGNITARSNSIEEIIKKINEAFEKIYPDKNISINQKDIDFILGKTENAQNKK